MTLQQELAKPEYQALSNPERLALLKSKSVKATGRIEESKLKGLESIIAKNLWRDKMDDMKARAKAVLADAAFTAAEKSLANTQLIVLSGFHEAISEAKLANKAPYAAGGHSINLGDAEVYATFQAAKSVGLLSDAEVNAVLALATYDKPLFPDVTLHDVIAICNPELIDGTWHDLGEVSARQLIIKLKQKAPEQTHVLIQSRDVFADGVYGDWRHNTACHLESSGVYICKIRAESRQEVRWSCAYALDVEVS